MASHCIPVEAAPAIAEPRIRRARRAIGANFLLYGVAISSWAPMVPYVKTRLGLDERTLGFVMLGMGLGGLLTLPISGVLAHQYGTRTMMWIGAPCVCAFMPLLALAPSPWLLSACLFGFATSLGAMGIGMNSQAIEVDRLGEKPVLSRIHGIYSLGALAGSALMSALLRAGFPLVVCAAGLAACMLVLTLTQRNHLLASDPAPRAATKARKLFVMPPKRVVWLGLTCAILFMGEGSALDWSAVFLSSNRGVAPATAGLGFTAYAVAMAASRFLGDFFTHRFGKEAALRCGALCAATGIACAVTFPTAPCGFLGFALMGFGLANTVPVVFAASGHVSELTAPAALPTVTALGYIGLLTGPALIGMIAKAAGLPAAFCIVALLLLVVTARARVIRPL